MYVGAAGDDGNDDDSVVLDNSDKLLPLSITRKVPFEVFSDDISN